MMYRVVVRFSQESRRDDFEKRFRSFEDAISYFRFLVSLDFDGLLDSFWHVSVLHLSKPLCIYNNFNHG